MGSTVFEALLQAFLWYLIWASPERAPPGTSSLTFVFDTTGSMNDDLLQVQDGAKKILDTVLAQREKLIYNYVYVPFHDPRVGPVFTTTDSNAFQRHLYSVHVVGGGDCPEMSLSGIKLALEAALPSSFIYVFTDARSKDYHLEEAIINLIQDKQSSVVFVMTGDCGDRTHPGFRTYDKIAAASFGQVFHLEKTDVNKVLDYVRHSIAQKKVHIMYEVRDRGGSNIRQIPVDKYLSEMTLSLSGDKSDEDFLEISLIDPKGNKVEKRQFANESGTIDLSNIKLIRIKDPMPGIWRVRTTSRLKHTIRVLGHGSIDFKYGFATRVFDRIEQTHPRPISHQNSYLMVNMTGLLPPGTAVEIALVDYYGKELLSKTAIQHPHNPYLYYIGPFVPPRGLFFVRVKGEDDKSYEFQRIALTAISVAQAGGPRASMTDRTVAVVSQSVNLTCSVASQTEFTLYWYKGNERIAGPLFYPNSDAAIWTINEVTPEDRGQYRCEVSNEYGNHSAVTYVDTKEPAPEIVLIRNESVPIGGTAFLHCQTQSTHATVHWFRGPKIIVNSENTRVFPNGTLMIMEADRQDAGTYFCRVKTSGGIAEGTATLKLLDPPKTKVFPKTLFYREGEAFNISCHTTGDPKPEPQWFFKGNRIKPDHRKYYITYKNDLIVHYATEEDAGVYECHASSPAGHHVDSAVAQMAVKPKVKVKINRQMVGRGDSVVMECKVLAGNPRPKITWYRGAREISPYTYRYYRVEGERLTIQAVQDNDGGGQYSCLAQNVAGQDRGFISFDVGSIPTIVPTPETVRVNIDRSVTLQCRAIGYPTPKITWQRNGVPVKNIPGRFQLLPDGSLLITNAQIEDQDRYTCTAKNTFGKQDKTTMLMVTGLVSPILGHVPPEEQLIEGRDLRLSCVVVLGTPKPVLKWFKNGLPLEPSSNVIIEGGGSGLLIRNGNSKDEGRYTCAAISPAGNATINVNVRLIKKPVIEGDEFKEYVVSVGESVDLLCKTLGKPQPKIVWSLDGKPLSISSHEYKILPENTLRIHHVNPNHAGKYVCTATNVAGEAETVAELRVLSAPVIEPGQVSYNLAQGLPLSIPCTAKGDPKPEITWYLNDEEFKEGAIDKEGSLTIPSVKEKHRGQFKCIAKNLVGADERIVTLTVHTIPIIEGESKVVVVNVNETAVLPCPARAQPPPTRIWVYENDRIFPGPHHGTEYRFNKDGALVITSPQMNHAGRYTCHVSNLAGDDHVTYLLKVQEPPQIISNVPGTIDVVLGLALEIPCRAVGTPDPTITWERNGFQIIPDDNVQIDGRGTLRIARTHLSHRGDYKCIATNDAGKDVRSTLVVVQEPPQILPTTLSEYTTVEHEKIELRCFASGNPTPAITWERKGVPITTDTKGMRVTPDGSLIIESVENDDVGFYTCKASNPAGYTDKVIQLRVITAPNIPDQDTVLQEQVLHGQPFNLYCPVFSTPMPQITWHLDDRPIAEGDANIHLSDDKRRLHILKSRTTDAGSYKCVARNPAGEASKTFQVEVLEPPNLDESWHKKEMTVVENTPVDIGCPVSGIPNPNISWLVGGELLHSGRAKRGVVLAPNGKSLLIASAQLDHEGIYTCIATNKAGSLSLDVHLLVLAPPKLGEDETVEAVAGKVMTLSCQPEHEGSKLTYSWLVNGSETLPPNAQVILGGQRLYFGELNLDNTGNYQCRVRNTAGETTKNIDLNVIAPPQFRLREHKENVEVVTGTAVPLHCDVDGNPPPVVKWHVDGQPFAEKYGSLSDNGQKLAVRFDDNAQHRYTCEAFNKAGTISRDFIVQAIAPPKMNDEVGDRTQVEVLEGHSVTLECPISDQNGILNIEWLKHGKPLENNDMNMQLSLDHSRLVIVNVKKDDAGSHTCIAKNRAGQATREFEVIVLVPPKIIGKMVEEIDVIEGKPLDLECDFDADPIPDVKWMKDGTPVNDRIHLLNEKRAALIQSVVPGDAGNYRCSVTNKAGQAEKTFSVRVVAKPELLGSNETSEVEILLSHPITFECPIDSPIDVDLSWMKDDVPIESGTDNVQILNGGRHLLIKNVERDDQARYTCIARNKAGMSQKSFELSVLIPPTIAAVSTAKTVIENNSLLLPCVVDGFPVPVITWTKDGMQAVDLGSIQLLNEGQHLNIISAGKEHSGSYLCSATNKVGKAEIGFDVDVISRPTVQQAAQEVIEVNRNDSAVFKCLITDRKFSGEIIWLKDFHPILIDSHKYTVSQNNRKLHVTWADLQDEGTYSCRVKNKAGETRIDYKLIVLVPPEIIMLDKDKNRTVVESNTVTLSCPATGKPEPTIEWFKDGELLKEENVAQKIRSGRLEGNDLKIGRVQVADSGRYTCEAKNKAGLAEQDVILYVTTPPRIEREGVPSEIGEKARSSVTISCPAYGRPTPTITWLKAGRPLEYSPDVYMSAKGMKLHFLSLNKDHVGRYTCIAKNPAGEDKRDFFLKLLEAPSIEGPNILRKAQVNAGRTTEINCPATGSPEPSIAWLKNGQPLASDDRHYVLLNSGRQLQITGATLADDARYTCIATNAIGIADQETYLQVIGGPEISGEKMESIEVIVNNPIDLDCDVTGTEPIEIEWHRDGQNIDFGGVQGGTSYKQVSARGRRLHIFSTQVSDTGRILCIARNSAGEARKIFDLKVLVPPTINETASSPALQTIIPETAFGLDCKVDAIPEAKIVWKREGHKIRTSRIIELSNGGQTLWFNRAFNSHNGRYTCEATNKVGQATRDFIVRLAAPPKVDQGQQEKTVEVGEYVILTCNVISGTGNITVNWLVDGRAVSNGQISPSVLVDNRRIQIRSARLSDSGRYTCVVKNEAGQARKNFDLSVVERPRFTDLTNTNPSIIVGRPLVLDCTVKGIPKPTVTWLKDGKPIENSTLFVNDRQQMHIESASEGDAGQYTCIAENRPGRTEKVLIVAILKPPEMVEKHRAFELPENDTLTLICPISDPTVKLKWLKNGVPITTSPHLQLSIGGSKLHLIQAQVSDSGQYTCLAKNEAGEDSSRMDVTVLVPPKIVAPSFRSVEMILNQTVQIECKTTGTPPPEITWTFDGRTVFPSDRIQMLNNGSILRLIGVQADQEGRYSCTATNKVGRAEVDTFLSVSAPPRIVTPSDELKVIKGHGQTIRCEVSGSPPPKVEWLKNGEKFNTAMTQYSSNLHYIHIREAEAEDQGRYTCIATNRAGEERMTTQLHVLVPPDIMEGRRVYQVKENSSLAIDCQATGNPPPHIVWKRDGAIVESSQGSKLVISSPVASDAGRFTCEAKNEAGTATAHFEVDVSVKPKFRDLKSEIRVMDGERARLECKVDGHPTPTITWLRGGRSIENMKNFILSPRGENLMILKTKRTDAGSYSCVAKNSAGESVAQFTVTVLTKPHIDEQIDQTPRVVEGTEVTLHCPVLGNPKPTVHWLDEDGLEIADERFKVVDNDLVISNVQEEDDGRYTCHAVNEAGTLNTVYALEVIGPPRFHREGDTVYEVIVNETVVMDCGVVAEPKPDIKWYKRDSALYIDRNIEISGDGQRVTIRRADLGDGGKYTCKASNEAGSADIDLVLKILVPPRIDTSNIVGNPLAISGRSIHLECPVTGIPQPTVTWYKEGNPIDFDSERFSFDQGNQTFGIKIVEVDDEGRYYCVAENKGGKSEQEFDLEVLVPPQLETVQPQKFTKREDDSLTLTCPIKYAPDSSSPSEITWYKDGRPVDGSNLPFLKISSDGHRLHLSRTTLADAGNYSCIAQNRAGDATLYFNVEILSAPKLDGSRNSLRPQVIAGKPITLWCTASGHPFPKIRWLKDGREETGSFDNGTRILDNGQGLEIFYANEGHSGIWTCEAENDAGKTELEFSLDVWTPPKVRISPESAVGALDKAITLHCSATGNPSPALSWSKEGQPLISSAEGARISLRGTRVDIPRLQPSHVGQYTCTARNEAGTAEASVHVDVHVPPMISRENIEMSPRLPTTQTLTLLCDASGKPYPKLQWYANGTLLKHGSAKIVIEEEGRYIQINNISLADRGSYKCVASNVAGKDELLYNVAVVQSPSILNGGTLQVVEGRVAKIVCDAQGEPTPLVQWQRNGVRVETGARYIAEGKSLTVIESRSSDSGIYVCVATNEAGTAQQAFTLEVLVAPRIVTVSPEESTVAVGTPFTLKCGARGYPPPEITWTLNDNIIGDDSGFSSGDDGMLHVEAMLRRGRHIFKCKAENAAGVDEKQYLVTAISPPTLSKGGIKVTNSTIGDASLLVCEIEGQFPEIYWFKEGAPITQSANVNISDDHTLLTIISSKLSDEGNYTCVAVNPAGNATQKMILYVGVPPRITERNRTITVKEGEEAELWCEAVGIPKPHVTWLKDSKTLPQNVVQDIAGTVHRSKAAFPSVTRNDSGVYTCTAENWAGKTYVGFDLIVLIPPQIDPVRVNVTANPGQSVVLSCNASGNPEPVIDWVKVPNIDIARSNRKYEVHETFLVIKAVGPEDDGFYQCIAKSEAGQAIGVRRLTVNVQKKDYKNIWVECDEKGKPVKTTFVPARGDVPDDEENLLPWKSDYQDLPENGTNGMIIRCLPATRGRRTPLETPPHFVRTPRTQSAPIGSVVELHCSAIGPPTPIILWMKDGKLLTNTTSVNGHSILRIAITGEESAGSFVCLAQNNVGESRTLAKIIPEVRRNDETEKKILLRKVALLNCMDGNKAHKEHVTWTVSGGPVNENDDSIHVMNNGSLVLLDVDNIDPADLALYQCSVRNRRQTTQLMFLTAPEEVPKVIIHPNKIFAKVGQQVTIECDLLSAPLTTKVEWTKNNIPIDKNDERITILANNALRIKKLRESDRASYKCRASSRRGRAYDGVELIVQDGPDGVVGFVDGTVNDEVITNQALRMNVVPEMNENSVYIKVDKLIGNHDAVARAMVGYLSASCPELAYDPDRRSPLASRGMFERLTDYHFDTGEEMRVKHMGRGMEGSYLKMDVLFDGRTPRAKHYDSISLDESEEEMVEEAPGFIRGRGSSALRLGKHTRIPFYWNHSINYDASKGMKIGPGKTLNVKLETDHVMGEKGYKVETKATRINKCAKGFKNINGFCEDIDECEMQPDICGEEGRCVNDVGGYSCERYCPPGYKVKLDGSCVDVDECSLGLHNCTPGTQCTNKKGGFRCETECSEGFFMNEIGECEDINECLSSPCKSPTECVNQIGTYICLCPSGFPEDEEEGCQDSSTETSSPTKILKFEDHSCPEGYTWTGFVCEDIDECSFDSPCQHECINTDGGYVCQCPEGYEVDEDDCIDLDECLDDPCEEGDLCFNQLGDYECISEPCPRGYYLDFGQCIPSCSNCSKSPIPIHKLALPRGVDAGTSLLRLTAYDGQSRVLHRTRFTLKPLSSFFRRSPFNLKIEGGRAVLQNSKPLLTRGNYKLSIRSVSRSPFSHTKYHSEFLIFISVSDNTF